MNVVTHIHTFMESKLFKLPGMQVVATAVVNLAMLYCRQFVCVTSGDRSLCLCGAEISTLT